jgi:hypothetical protein
MIVYSRYSRHVHLLKIKYDTVDLDRAISHARTLKPINAAVVKSAYPGYRGTFGLAGRCLVKQQKAGKEGETLHQEVYHVTSLSSLETPLLDLQLLRPFSQLNCFKLWVHESQCPFEPSPAQFPALYIPQNSA